MEPVRRVVGRALPLDRENVDTDQIIPAHWLKRTERTGYGAGLFEAWRRDPAFVLNDARYQGARVLVAGANFGSGSSREHAAWALLEGGFRAVVAPKFADIFRGNALRNGLVPVTLATPAVDALMRAVERDPALEVVVDVEAGAVHAAAIGLHEHFVLEARARDALLNGWDEIEITQGHAAEIAAFEARRPAWLPMTTRRAT
jgi:3-isopropylmalate/(R)-2-methylmalate dehydratase small subunit